jgi:hypothetical protein
MEVRNERCHTRNKRQINKRIVFAAGRVGFAHNLWRFR